MQKKDIRNPLTIGSYLLIKAARRADMPDDPHTTNGMIVEQI